MKAGSSRTCRVRQKISVVCRVSYLIVLVLGTFWSLARMRYFVDVHFLMLRFVCVTYHRLFIQMKNGGSIETSLWVWFGQNSWICLTTMCNLPNLLTVAAIVSYKNHQTSTVLVDIVAHLYGLQSCRYLMIFTFVTLLLLESQRMLLNLLPTWSRLV